MTNGPFRELSAFEDRVRAVIEPIRAVPDLHARLSAALDGYTDGLRALMRDGHPVKVPKLGHDFGAAEGA